MVEQLQFLRCAFLVRLGEQENVENLDKAGLRAQLLQAAEDGLRQSLKQLQTNFEVADLQNKISNERRKLINTDQEALGKMEEQLELVFSESAVSEQDKKGFCQNAEEQMCHADAQGQVLSQILRIRMLIGRVYRKQGLYINSFYVLRQSLQNFKAMAEGATNKVEDGAEAKDKGSFSLPDIYGGAAGYQTGASQDKGGAKGGKAAPAKAAPPKQPAKGGKESALDAGDEQSAAEEAARKAKLEAEREVLRA